VLQSISTCLPTGIAVNVSNVIGSGFVLPESLEPKVKGLKAVKSAFVITLPAPAPEQVPPAVPGRSSHEAPFHLAIVRSGQLLIPLTPASSQYNVRLAFPAPALLQVQYSTKLTLAKGAFAGVVLTYAELKYSAVYVSDAEIEVTAQRLHLVPFPTGKTKSVVPVFDMGPDTKLAAEPLPEVATLLKARIFAAVVYNVPDVKPVPHLHLHPYLKQRLEVWQRYC